MSISDSIHIAEGQISDLQRTLGVVESALETADAAIVTGQKVGRRLARILGIVLVIGAVIGVVIAVKKLLERRCGANDEVILTVVEDDESMRSSTADAS
jgi:tetrahydromethanopterin S-methyltransferase subunit G